MTDVPVAAAQVSLRRRLTLKPGDLALPVFGHSLLYQVIQVYDNGMMTVRGLDWPAGYTAVVKASDFRPGSGRLFREES